MDKIILAGDIGGTKSYLALVRVTGNGLEFFDEIQVPSTSVFTEVGLIKKLFEKFPDAPKPSLCVLGVAGTVRGGFVEAPNLPWTVDAYTIKEEFKMDEVAVMNDLAMTAYGAQFLPKEKLFTLNEGEDDPHGNSALIAAGTGLGEAIMMKSGKGYEVLPSEGGHATFAPLDEWDMRFLAYMRRKHGHVSYERVVSGRGLVTLYNYIIQAGIHPQSERVRVRMSVNDPAGVISSEAIAKTDPACMLAMGRFAIHYGSEAGNLALKALATGGLYLGGGIAPKVLMILRRGGFMKAFKAKGRLSWTLGRMPVKVILEPKTALYGAAHYAEHMLK